MFTFRAFGGACLENDAAPLPGPVAQRRRLAVLALLAASPTGRIGREKLTAYLWPESDAESARHSLGDALHALRKALGKEAILAVGDELRLNRDVVRADVGEFKDALAQGDPERAVVLYRGPFLDGFFVPDAPEFERWAEEERKWLAGQYLRALDALASGAEERRDLEGAAEWWRTLAAQDPYNSRVTLRLIRALAATGDRAAALQHAQIHAALLREEFGAEPDPDVAALAERLRSEPVARRESPPVPRTDGGDEALPDLPGDDRVLEARGVPAPAVPAAPDRSKWPLPGAPPQVAAQRAGGRWRGGHGVVVLATAGLAVAAMLGVPPWTRTGPAPRNWSGGAGATEDAPLVADRIAVLPFAVSGDAEARYLGTGLVHLLGTSLNSAARVRSVDAYALLGQMGAGGYDPADPASAQALARRFGAGSFVLGRVTQNAGRLRIQASLYPSTDIRRPAAQMQVEGEADQLFSLVDELAAKLLASTQLGPRARLARLASVTTASLPALTAYLDGETAYREGRYEDALELYRRATTADTAFALAWYRTSMTLRWLDLSAAEQRVTAERALRHSRALSQRDRLLLEANLAFMSGRFDDAERFYGTLVGMHPEDIEAWYQLGETLFHLGPLRGVPIERAVEPFQRVLALDARHTSAVLHLVRVLALQRRTAELDSLARRGLALRPHGVERMALEAIRAFALDDTLAQARLLAELRTASDLVLISTLWNVNVFTHHFAGGRRLLQLVVSSSRAPEVRARGHILGAYMEMAQGRWHTTNAHLAEAAELDPDAALAYRAFLAALPFAPVPLPQRQALRDSVAHHVGATARGRTPMTALRVHDEVEPHLRLYLEALLALRTGRDAEVLPLAARLERLPSPALAPTLGRELAGAARAHAAHAEGRLPETLAALEQVGSVPWADLALESPLFSRAYERWLRAETLRATGRGREALRWYSSFAGLSTYDLVFLAPAHLRSAEIYDRLGEIALARLHYTRFVELWKESDTELRPLVRHAQHRLRQMRTSR